MTNSTPSLQDPELELSSEIEIKIVRFMKNEASKGVLEHTLTDIHEALKTNGIEYPKAQVSSALARLSDRRRGVLNVRKKGKADFYSLQAIIDLCHQVWTS